MIQHAFQQRRKKIPNALNFFIEKRKISKEKLGDSLKKLGLCDNLRPENLTLKNYVDLAELLEGKET